MAAGGGGSGGGGPAAPAEPANNPPAPLSSTHHQESHSHPDAANAQSSLSLTAEERDRERWRKIFFNVSVGVVVAAPVVAALPPRRLDLNSFGLGLAWLLCAGHISEEMTGRGLIWHLGSRIPSEGNARRRAEEARTIRTSVASEQQQQQQQQQLHQNQQHFQPPRPNLNSIRGGPAADPTDEAPRRQRGRLADMWNGGEGDDWVQDRLKREQEALEDGRGYSGLIMDHVREAFGFTDSSEEEAAAAALEGDQQRREPGDDADR